MKLSKTRKNLVVLTLALMFCLMMNIGLTYGTVGGTCGACGTSIDISVGQDTTGYLTVNKELAGNAIPTGADTYEYGFSLTGDSTVSDTVTPSTPWSDEVTPGSYTIAETDANGATVSYSGGPSVTVDETCTRIYATATLDSGWGNVLDSLLGTPTLSYTLTLGSSTVASGTAQEGDEVEYTPLESGTYTWTFSWDPIGLFSINPCGGGSCFFSGSESVEVTLADPAEVTIVNTWNGSNNEEKGNLIVTKVVNGTGTPPAEAAYQIQLNDAQTYDIVVGENPAIELPVGNYSITESKTGSADSVDYSATEFSIVNGQTTYITITNTYNGSTPGEGASITIVKRVTGDNAPDDDALFDITLYKYNSETKDMDVYETFQLADDGSITFDVDPGTYEVEEADVDYDHFRGVVYTQEGPFDVADDQQKTVTITNRFTNNGGGGGSSSGGGGSSQPDNPTVEVAEPEPEPPVFQPPIIEVPEPIVVPEPLPELPKTGASSVMLMSLGLLLTGGGIMVNRFRK